MNINIPQKHCLENFIAKDFQEALSPLNLLQSLCLIHKVKISDNFITPNTTAFHVKSFLGTIVLCAVHYYRYLHHYEILRDFTLTPYNIINVLLYFDCVLYVSMTILYFVVNAWQSKNMVSLILKLQSVSKKLDVNETFLLHFKYYNWFYVACMFGYYSLFTFLSSATNMGLGEGFRYMLYSVPQIIFDLSVISATRTVDLVQKELKAWIAKLKRLGKVRIANIHRQIETENEVSGKEMFNVYNDIQNAFGLCTKVYQFTIVFIAAQTFIHILANIQMLIEFDKMGSTGVAFVFQSTLLKITLVCWNLKNFIYLTSLSVVCEKYYTNVKLAEFTSIQVLKNARTPGLRQTCKNVMRYNRSASRKLRAGGVLAVDATLPSRLLAAVLGYTVVLLQFAFLQ